jgi:ABC-type transporter Mla MlaB component
VGIFSFLKKKGDTAESKAEAPPRPEPKSEPVMRMARGGTEAERERQREIARATAAKIDEIELEMASAIFEDDAWGGSRRTPAVATAAGNGTLLDINTEQLLGPEDLPDSAMDTSSAPVVEEAAILYANGQAEAAELALRGHLDDIGRTERLPWWMLFDLYQIAGREPEFESIAIDYASHFGTSPPAYQPLSAPVAGKPLAGVIPTASLAGQLDEGAGAPLARVLASASGQLARLEFSGITGATPEGCKLLLDALQRLRKGDRELVLVGADQLVAMLHPMLTIGERDASQAPWLLLLELLLLTNREKDFEETAMDYCVTFEVSPPSFEPPPHTALSLNTTGTFDGDRFLLQGVVEGDSGALLSAIDAYAGRQPAQALVLDCSRLTRMDYAAANALGARLRTLAEGPRKVELRDLNHLVATLLHLLGASAYVDIYTHKY